MSTNSFDYEHLVQPGRTNRLIYVEPRIFEQELTRVFGSTWVYLAHESQISAPSSFTTVSVGRRPLIITRDAEGCLHALFNRCAHRASTVCQAVHGSATRFQCDYHGWTY